MKKEISPAIPSLNVALLRKVQKKIAEEPKRLYMYGWYLKMRYGHTMLNPPSCKTVGCIAGWTVIESGLDPGRVDVLEVAMKKLGIKWLHASKLFYSEEWPGEFYYNGDRKKISVLRKDAETTVRRIDHFIKTGE